MSSTKESKVMTKPQLAPALAEQSDSSMPPELCSIVRGAVTELDDDCPSIIEGAFGLSGTDPLTDKEIAKGRGDTERNVKDLREDALRALMGYGSKARRNRVIV